LKGKDSTRCCLLCYNVPGGTTHIERGKEFMPQDHCDRCSAPLVAGASQCPTCNIYVSTPISTNPYADEASYHAIPFVEYRASARSNTLSPDQHHNGSIPVSHTTPSSFATATLAQLVPQAAPATIPEPPRLLTVPKIAFFLLLSLLLIAEAGLLNTFINTIHPAELEVQATSIAQDYQFTQKQNTALASLHATATANALTPEQLYSWATSGPPLIDDPLNKPEGTVWFHTQTKTRSCDFAGGAYHIRHLKAGDFGCSAPSSYLHDLAFQVQITFIKGTVGGIIFRNSSQRAYFFYITPTGYYGLAALGKDGQILIQANNPSLVKGYNQTNQITAIARGDQIYLYINNKLVGQTTNSLSSEGQLGLRAEDENDSFDVAFSNVKVWRL
jgi:hypothetical protein